MNKKLFYFLCLLAPAAVFAQGISAARQSVDQDLESAIEQLAELREEIKDEKIPLSKELNELRSELNQKRREVERIQRIRDNKTVDLNRLRDSVSARREELDYLANLVSEYGTSFRVRMNLAETQLYEEQIEEFSAASDNASLSKDERLLDQVGLVGTGLDRVDRLFGGDSFPGRAVLPSGELQPGTFVILGPASYFAGEQATAPAGLSINTGGLDPSVYPLGEEFDEMIRSVAATGEGLLPLDSTLGDALAVKREETTLWEHIQQGGIWIWPILFFAFLATVTALYKIFEIYTVKMPKPGTLHEVLKRLNAGEDAEALEFAKSVPGPVGKMLVDAVAHADESKELVEEVMYERMLEVQPKLERLLPFIAVTAATAPLMGLLGTVTGMIKTFKLITIFGTGDAKSLASGISEALVTTEFGLIVAIPALIMHALLTRRAQGVMASMERMAVAFVNGLNRKK